MAVLYCSGDVHIGNVTQNYDTEPESGIPTVQTGYINSISAATWAQQQGLGTLDHLVVSGSSAGALGTQAAADFIPEFVASNQVSVIIDSYVGVFDCLGPLLERYGRSRREFNFPVAHFYERLAEAGPLLDCSMIQYVYRVYMNDVHV